MASLVQPEGKADGWSAARAAPLAIVSCSLWSTGFVVIKLGLQHAPPLTFAGWRFMLAGCLLLPLCGGPGNIVSALRNHWRLIVVVGLCQTVVLYGTLFWGLKLLAGAQAAIITGASPLVAAMFAHMLMADDRMSRGKAAAIAMGMTGIVIIAVASKPWQPAGLASLGGMGLLMVGTCSSAIASIFVARKGRVMSPVVLCSMQMLLGGVVLTTAGAVVEGLPQSLPPVAFFLEIGWLAMVSAVGFSIWFFLLRHVKVSRLSMWKFLMPVFGTILSWSFLPGESPELATIAGMVCVATAVLLSHRQAIAADTGRAGISRPVG